MTPFEAFRTNSNRRSFLGQSLAGLGTFALAQFLDPRLFADTKVDKWTGAIKPHYKPKVKRVIWLCMAGGPSHLETFDPKPKLTEMNGKPMPESFTKGQPIAQLQGQALKCLGPTHEFKKCGKSGTEISTIFPHLADVADDICVIRSMKTDAINHDPAQIGRAHV